MRYVAPIVVAALSLSACAKSDGQICIDNYMKIYDEGHPEATRKARKLFKELVTARCTDPNLKSSY
jgi:hypothetical protein